MSEDMYEEVSVKSYGQRIKEALQGIVFGFGLIIGAFVLLFWNEGRSVERYKTLVEGEKAVISIPTDKINPQMEGKLIHVTGKAETKKVLLDPLFGIASKVLVIDRDAQMYQWQERTETQTQKQVGGSEKTITKYYYEKVWSSSLNNSSNFKKRQGHQNPSDMPIKSQKFVNNDVTLGAFKISKNLVSQISTLETFVPKSVQKISQTYKNHASIDGNNIYISNGGTPNAPQIGDMKISFKFAPIQDVSILAQQQNNSFVEFVANAGGTICLLYQGLHSSKAMFKSEHEANVFLTWALRFGGFIMMFIGWSLAFKVFSVLLDVLPFLGNLMGYGTKFVAFIISVILSLLTIAIAWLFYRPLISIIIFVIIGGLIFWLKSRKKKISSEPPKLVIPNEK